MSYAMSAPYRMNFGGRLLNISPAARYIVGGLLALIGLHSLLALTHEGYGEHLSRITAQFTSPSPAPPDAGPEQRENAVLLMLARNSDLHGAVQSVRELEDRWNRRHNYPWLFLNEEEFTDEFKTAVSVLTKAEVMFGVIPQGHWYQPKWVDEDRARAGREDLVANNVIYGGSVPYRNMCRFNSGFFYRHALMQQFKWYWRVEPDVHFFCDINHDPFRYMATHNKTYGWTISMYEFVRTVPTLWDHVADFFNSHQQYVADNNALQFISDDDGGTYNMCHFWSNFEIADLDFWRSKAYAEFFDHLDAQGGFYYERWGDAPVHSIAAAIMLDKNQLHFFDEIAYFHNPLTHCPADDAVWTAGRCACDQSKSVDLGGACKQRWEMMFKER